MNQKEVSLSMTAGSEDSSLDARTDIWIRDLSVTLTWTARSKFARSLADIQARFRPVERPTSKTILDNLSAEIRSGTLTAIVGGSGSGKTTLLSTISKRITDSKLRVSGQVSYNGVPLSFDRPHGATLDIPYVVQEDILSPQLTVQETLLYAAELRLHPSTSRQKREKLVREVMSDLGLTSCANTHIGDSLHKGCSGGEKRRTSVAIQMLTNRSVLFLDEPTTGLDAASAFQLVKILKRLARQGKTIVMTIHQPRSDIWPLLDNLIVLSKGTTIFSGPQNECLQYFEECGHQIPRFFNPFEFILDLSMVDSRTHEAETITQTRLRALASAWQRRHAGSAHGKLPQTPSKTQRAAVEASVPLAARDRISLLRRIEVLTRRTWKVTCRDPLGAVSSIIEAIIMGVVTGWIFYHVGSDLAGIRSREGAMWSAAGLQGYLILIFETYRLTIDIKVFDRERKEGVTSAAAFVASRRLARALLEDIPVPLIYAVILYFMAGFRHQSDTFFIFFAIIYLLHITAVSVATFCVAINRHFMVSSLIANMVYTLQSMACGFFVNTADISIWLRWTKWTAYVVCCPHPYDVDVLITVLSFMPLAPFATMNSQTNCMTVQSQTGTSNLVSASSTRATLFCNHSTSPEIGGGNPF
jgi:ABC-type multidrug transport system ATPase subunit